jgi:hypothetical protein
MGLPIGDIKLSANFEINIAKPIDARFIVNDISERNNISFKYEGMIVWIKSESKHYKLLNDLITWEEFGSSIVPISDLEGLNDVIITSAVNGQSLVYDNNSTSWINKFTGLNNHSSNKIINPLTTIGDGANSGVAISNKPLGDIIVTVNGVIVEVSFGNINGKCYFADPMNIGIARNYQEILPNDILIWNGTVNGYDLEITDEISFYYES